MSWLTYLDKWGFKNLKLNAGIFSVDFAPAAPDRLAAWELYVELLTRITTQPLPNEEGDEKTALDSVYSLFGTTRTVLKSHPGATQFARLAIVVLNQVVRPFTAHWHRASLRGAFSDPRTCRQFREELSALQKELRMYAGALAEMAGVEDLTKLEEWGKEEEH